LSVPPQLEIVLKNRPGEIERLHALLDEFGSSCALSLQVMLAVNLTLEELVSNIFKHGYGDSAEAEIRVKAVLQGSELNIEVEDTAPPFNLLDHPAPQTGLALDEKPIGGLGVHLVRKLMSEVEYQRDGNRNRVLLRKRTD
jgi:anti-sigma regulatory factor (Ser/Thr protein kinase)